MNYVIENNLIFIKSKDGNFNLSNDIRTDFNIILKSKIQKKDDELFKVIVQSVMIPYTFRNCNNTNNYIDWKEDGILKTPIQLREGNYNILEMINELQFLLNNNSSLGIDNYSLTYDQIDNKITIFSLSNLNTEFLFNSGINQTKSLAKQIGFTSDHDINCNNINPKTSDSFVDLIRIHSLFIRSNLSSNLTIDSSSLSNSDILVNIPINSNPLSVINYQYYEGMSYNLIDINQIDEISIQLTDQNGNLIFLGKQINFEMLLNIQIIKNPRYNMIPKIPDLNQPISDQNISLRKNFDILDEEVNIEDLNNLNQSEHKEIHIEKIQNIKDEIQNL